MAYYLVFAALIVISALFCIVLRYCYDVCFYHPHRHRKCAQEYIDKGQDNPGRQVVNELMKSLLERKYVSYSIRSFDGTALYAKYYHIKDGAPLEIAFHGYRSCGERDFCGGADICKKVGINLLIVEQRSHGASTDNTITFGIKERYDVAAWVDFAVEQFGKETQILLCGVSMGAATVLMASDLDLPDNVKCIVADCPYSSPKEIITHVCSKKGYPVGLFYPMIKLSARFFGKFELTDLGAIDSVGKTNIPILFIHGDEDDFVPTQMSKRMYNVCTCQKQIEIFPEATHAMSYVVDPVRYEKIIIDFVSKYVDLKSK